MDARQGYHQVAVHKSDKEKPALFAPDDQKYCFIVMPFGPTNSPGFYTAMMRDFKEEWDTLFILRVSAMKQFLGKNITVTATNEILIGTKKLVWGSKTIIDDILLWCDEKDLVLTLFTCVCEVFQKYRVSFRLDKCEFSKKRVKYVGHDILCHGNAPVQSKFNLLNDWALPTSG